VKRVPRAKTTAGKLHTGSRGGSNVGDHVHDVLAGQSLGEQGGPDGLNLQLSGFNQGRQLVGLIKECEPGSITEKMREKMSERAGPNHEGRATYRDFDLFVGQDERGVHNGFFGDFRHFVQASQR
jgi:hypothetical protein